MESVHENRDRGKSGGMKKFGITVVVLVTGVLGLWLYFFPSYSWHQKMTVEVEVDGQVYSGSSVVEVLVSTQPRVLPEIGGQISEFQGEAVVVELPEDKYLFALLTYNAFLATKVFQDQTAETMRKSAENWPKVISQLRATGEVTPKDYPLLVTFTDINDPKTVKQVESDDLEIVFGPGVHLKRITLEITDEPVTDGKIEAVVGFLDDRTFMKNPGWRNLPSLTQNSIYGLRKPVKPLKE